MPQQLDLTDKKILLLLSQNCRISNTAIGRHLRLAREVVAYRIQQLMKREIITGFFTLIDQRRLGFETFQLFLKLKNVTKENEMVDHLLKREDITFLALCSGRYDVLFDVTVPAQEDFQAFLNSFLLRFSSSIYEYHITNFLEEDCIGNQFLLSDQENNNLPMMHIKEKGSSFISAFGNKRDHQKKALYSAIDKKILTFLLFNARATLKEISDATSTTPAGIKTKIHQLIIDGAIKQFTPLLSFAALGYQWFMIFLQIVGIPDKTLDAYFAQQSNIQWRVKSIGPWNYQLSVLAKNSKEFHGILNKIREEFKENIIYFDFIIVFNQLKFGGRV